VNRTDRLHAISEALRRAGPAGTTGRRLARALEVSERTIKRDICALQQAGSPIWAQAGPGGGYVLDAAATLPPVNFTPAQALAVAVALAALPAGSPFGVDGAAALGKLRDAMSSADRTRADELAARVWTRSPLPAAATVVGGTSPGVLRAVEQGLSRSRVLTITYRAGDGAVTGRRVEPILLAHTEGRWYLVAWCRLRASVRWFRLERVEQASLTPEAYEPRPVAEVGTPPVDAGPVGARVP
jgi:predicted DNA-binding transcriptional regulator YafY